jgi:hypothetical protein
MKTIAFVVISSFAVLAAPTTGQSRSSLIGATRFTAMALETALDLYEVDNGTIHRAWKPS